MHSTSHNISIPSLRLPLCFSFLLATPVYSYFDRISLTSPSSSQSDATHDTYTHYHDHSSTTVNHIEVKDTDQLTLVWLLQKSHEGPIEELHMVRKNRGFYEHLLKQHIYSLYQQKAANNRFSSNAFFSCACLMAFCTFFAVKISYPIAQDIFSDYQDIHPHPFVIVPALVALAGPLGMLGSGIAGIKAFFGYQDSLDERIQEAQNLLNRLQAM